MRSLSQVKILLTPVCEKAMWLILGSTDGGGFSITQRLHLAKPLNKRS